MCKNCLKKGTTHTVDSCRAPSCHIRKGAHNALICTEEGGQQSIFNECSDEETKGEGDKESKGDNGNTGNGGASDIERMNQQRGKTKIKESTKNLQMMKSLNK